MTSFFQFRFKQPFLLFLLVVLVPMTMLAQKTISGKVVSDETQQPLSGASVTLKKSGKVITADASGSFSVQADEQEMLTISNVGYISMDVKAADAGLVLLKPDSRNMSEVVITALGIKKDKKKLGYAIQEIKGDELTVARETNVVNQLAGKVEETSRLILAMARALLIRMILNP